MVIRPPLSALVVRIVVEVLYRFYIGFQYTMPFKIYWAFHVIRLWEILSSCECEGWYFECFDYGRILTSLYHVNCL